MQKNSVLYLILFVFLMIGVQSYTSVNTAWSTNPYFRADNSKVINSNTNGGATRTRTFWFSSMMTGTPSIAYGIKSFKGTDRLYETNFEIKQVSLSSLSFRVSVELFGTSSMWMLQVQYFAVDPSFPFHMNTFDDMPIQYSSTLTNITTSSSALTTFTQIINYSLQSAANTFKTFTPPMNYNKIVYYITSMRLTSNSSASFKLDLGYSILNTTHYSLTASVFHYGTVNNLRLSLIIYNDYDIKPADQFEIINYNWVDDGTGGFYSTFPQASQDNMICGLSSFGTNLGNCALDYQWDYNNNIAGSLQSIELSRSKPSANSSATCGQNFVKSTLFYIKSWNCPAPYRYFNQTSLKCQNACASYYYYNTTVYTCTPCYYACFNCTLAGSKTSCSTCETGLKRYLVNNTCLCSTGYFDDGFEPGCQACTEVDPKSLSCTYTIDPLQPTTFYQDIFNQTTWATDILPNFTSITCVTAYFVNTSRLCQACSSYCITCTDSITCTTCNSSSPAILYTDNLCYLCNIPNCLACYPDSVCVSCSSPLVVSQGVCMTCVLACVCNGWVLPKINGTCSTLCGDGIKVGLEECDDGNLNDHDGCSSTCKLEPCNVSCLCDGWTSPWNTGNNSCTSICGDGLLRGNQQCDDGNVFDHDGCSSICINEPCEISCLCNGWVYPWLTTSCSTLCGDGYKVGSQECDDGNLNNHDGCSSTCTLQPCSVSCLCDGWVHPWIVQNNTCSTVCGDGYVRGVEQCDDGNLNNGDGCNFFCIVEPPLLMSQSMSQYPALVLFALGFRIVGLQALNVIQSFQLILDSIKLYSFRISFNIHGYTDKQNFPIPIPNQQNFLTKFNFMYFIVAGFFVVGVILQIYNLCCHKANKVSDSHQQNVKKHPTKNQHSQVQNNSDSQNGDDFAVHYKGQSKLKANESQMSPMDQSNYIPKQQQKPFWGILFFRQIFFNLLVNLLSVFAYSFADQIKSINLSQFLNFQSLAVLITMIIFFILICLLFAFKNLSFGQNLLKFNKGQVLEYWILLIGQKIVFSAILGTKSFWSLEVILVLKFFLLTYYCCSRLFFEHLQKVRSVTTHFIHFMLIFAVIISEHIFKPHGLYETFPTLFMEYIYLALLCLVIFICFIFCIRQMMHCCEADLRQIDDSEVSVVDNLAMSAVFDVKNMQKMQESAQQFAIKGPSSIMDEIKTKKNIRKSSDFLDVPTQVSNFAAPKKVSTLNDLNLPLSSATSLMGRSSIKTKNNLQSNIKSHRESHMMSVIQMEEQNQIQEIDMKSSYQNTPKHERNQSGVDQEDIKIRLNNSTIPDGHTSNSSYSIQPPKGFKNYANKLVLKNKNKLKQHEKNYKTDVQMDFNQIRRQSGQQFDPSYETDDPQSRIRKQSKQMTFHKNKYNIENYSELFYSKTGDEGNKGKLQIHDIYDPNKTEEGDHDATSINLE